MTTLSAIITPTNVLTANNTETLTNKTIDYTANTITNLPETNPAGSTGQVQYNDDGAFGALADGTAGQVLTSAGSGAAPIWSTPTVTAPAGSTGQVQYNNAGAFDALSSGTSGQVLTSAGSGAAPIWADAGGGGAWTYLAGVDASGAATVNFPTQLTSTYDMYAIVGVNIRSSTDTVMTTRFTTDNGASYPTSNYFYQVIVPTNSGSAALTYSSSSQSSIQMNDSTYTRMISNTGYAASLLAYIPLPSEPTNTRKVIRGHLATSYGNQVSFSGYYNGSTVAITGFQLMMFSGTITGSFRLYGIKNS